MTTKNDLNELSNISDILSVKPIKKTNLDDVIKTIGDFRTKYGAGTDNTTTILYFGGSFLMILLFIIICIYLFTSKYTTESNSSASKSAEVFLLVIFIIGIIGLTAVALYKFKDLAKYIYANGLPTLYFVLFNIAILVLFGQLTSSQKFDYASVILFFISIISAYIFYLIIKQPLSIINPEYNKYNIVIIFVCLISFLSVMYNVDPGGYIKKNMGFSLVFILMMIVFGLLYLLTVFQSPRLPKTTNRNMGDLLKRFSMFSIISVIFFIIAVIIITIGFVDNETNLLNISDENKGITFGLTAFFFMLYALYFVYTLFPRYEMAGSTDADKEMSSVTGVIRGIALLFFGILFSGTLIWWLVYTAQNISSQSGTASFIVNLVIILIILAILYKYLSLGNFYQQHASVRLLVNIVLYIPCLIVSLIDSFMNLFGFSAAAKSAAALKAAKTGIPAESPTKYLWVLGLTIVGYSVYLLKPYVAAKFAKQGGRLLVNQPVYLNKTQVFGSYQSLNNVQQNPDASENNQNLNGGSGMYNYNYAISFWFFLDATNPEKNIANKTYTPILSYGGKPCVQYNPNANTLMVTMPPSSHSSSSNRQKSGVKSITKYDDNGNVIVYTKPDVLLQKWNNMIINYNGGTLDIFYNGELAKSVPNMVPYMSQDNLVIGSDNGLNGGICNVNYFNTVIDAKQIYYLYNFVKNKTPPITTNSMDTIVNTISAATHQETSKTNTNAVIDSILVPAENVVEKTTDANVEPDINTFNANNFLSLRWYMTGHGDNYGVP
jgi:hypothetical protein